MVTDRPTTSRRGRAWVPAVVGAGFVAVLLFASSLVREVLDDRNVDRFGEGHLHMFVLNAMAPIGRPGIVVDGPGGDTVDLLLSLAAVALVVLVLTWLVSLAARDLAGAVTVLVGTWLATALGVALGGLVRNALFFWDVDYVVPAQTRFSALVGGLYWGTVAGLLVGLVAMLAWLVTRRRVVEDPAPVPDHPSTTGPATTHEGPTADGPAAQPSETQVLPAQQPDQPAAAPAYPPPTGDPAGPTGTVRAPEQRAAEGLDQGGPGAAR